MALERFGAIAPSMPREIVAELHDGLSLALDALGGSAVRRSDINQALSHLRWARRRADHLISLGGSSDA